MTLCWYYVSTVAEGGGVLEPTECFRTEIVKLAILVF